MNDGSLSLKTLELFQENKKHIFTLSEIQQKQKITSIRQNELKKSLELLEENNFIKRINKNSNDIFCLVEKQTKNNSQKSNTSKHKFRISQTPLSRFKVSVDTQINDLPNNLNDLQLMKLELLNKKRNLKNKMIETEKKAKLNKKCEGKNLNELILKWKKIVRELIITIQNHDFCRKENGEKFNLKEILNKFDIDLKFIGYNEENDDFNED